MTLSKKSSSCGSSVYSVVKKTLECEVAWDKIRVETDLLHEKVTVSRSPKLSG